MNEPTIFQYFYMVLHVVLTFIVIKQNIENHRIYSFFRTTPIISETERDKRLKYSFVPYTAWAIIFILLQVFGYLMLAL